MLWQVLLLRITRIGRHSNCFGSLLLRGAEYELVDGEWDSDDAATQEENQQEGQVQGQGGSQEGLTQEQLAEMLFQALAKQDRNLMRTVARQSVQRFAGMEPGRPVGGTYYLYRTLRNLNLEEFWIVATSSADSEPDLDFS